MAVNEKRRGYGRPTLAEGPAVTLEQIVATSLGIAEKEGFDALTMRRIADELGVWPRAVYHHIQSKDRLLELVAYAALGSQRPKKTPAGAPWDVRLRAILEGWWEVLHRYDGLAEFLLSHPLRFESSDQASTDNEDLLAALFEAGLDPGAALRLWFMLTASVLGLIQFEGNLRDRRGFAAEDDDPDAIVAGDYPHTASMVAEILGTDDLSTAFAESLDVFIAGLKARKP